MKYIIDGYNVVHKIAKFQDKRLRSQREGLIRLLEIAKTRNKRLKDITVVFDGQGNVLVPQLHSTIKIIFSKGESADKKIKKIMESSNYARDIAVVSDDRQIRSYVRILGGKKISVSEFLRMVSSSFIEQKNHTFKLDKGEADKITQELEQVWLNK